MIDDDGKKSRCKRRPNLFTLLSLRLNSNKDFLLYYKEFILLRVSGREINFSVHEEIMNTKYIALLTAQHSTHHF